MFEVDFLPVGDSNGDAICMQYSVDNGVYVHVIDGAYAETGERIVEHIQRHYGRDFFINHMVLSHADNDHATGLVEVMKRMNVQHLWMNRPVAVRDRHVAALPRRLHARRARAEDAPDAPLPRRP